jgi:FdrA protein
MPLRALVRRSAYRDSMVLMRVAEAVRALPGVREAAALMGTPANHELMAAAGLATDETKDATAGDLVIAVLADTDAAAVAGVAEAERVLAERRPGAEASGSVLARTLDAALRRLPDANLAAISVPGQYAAFEAQRALRRGLHVFLFSDNVSVDDEIALKRLAVERGLFCMGPDCGTAYLGGVGLGFANVVPRGRVGCVAASGTGLQAVASRLTALGEGVSHAIGVGGRDLSSEVGAAMTLPALEALAADATTEVVVVIGKPPAPAVVPRLEAAIARVAKPVVVCCLGARPAGSAAGLWVGTLDDAAELAVATLRGHAWSPRVFGDVGDVRARLARVPSTKGTILGLYTGGTLAHESGLVLEPLVGARAYRLIDLGADEFTRGRPHPMLDPDARAARVRRVGDDPDVAVLLLDLVLGRAVHPDPAAPLAAAVEEARHAAAAHGRALATVASIVGTDGDPQDVRRQAAVLEAAGVELLPSNAQAARFAALLTRPNLARSLGLDLDS